MIVFEDTTEPLPTLDIAVHDGIAAKILNEFVVKSLVIALEVVVRGVFLHGLAQVTLAQRDDLGQAL